MATVMSSLVDRKRIIGVGNRSIEYVLSVYMQRTRYLLYGLNDGEGAQYCPHSYAGNVRITRDS